MAKTAAQLKALSENIFPDNENGDIGAKGNRAFNEAMIDSMLMAVDLASTDEVLTGKLFNGKPVYYKRLRIELPSPLNAGSYYDAGIVATGVTYAWIDYGLSFQAPGGDQIPLIGMASGTDDQNKALAYINNLKHIYIKNVGTVNGGVTPTGPFYIAVYYVY